VRQIAYIMSRFPKITETFILYEILELRRIGLEIEIFPLIIENEAVKHPEVETLTGHVHYNRILSKETLAAQLYWLYKQPKNYLRAWWRAIRGNFSSPKFLARTLITVPMAAQFARQIQALGIKHIHAHWATHPTLAGYVIHQLTNLPYSFTIHAHDLYVERPMLDEKVRLASFVVTISEYNRQLLQELYGTTAADKTIVVHCGIEPEVFQPQPTKSSTGPFTIICIASLEEYKGHPYLLEACAQLKAEGIDFRCLLVGEGSQRSHLESQIMQLGLDNHVTLLGRQPRSRVQKLLDEADVMALPSVVAKSGKKEGIPVALMEALAMELPAIATRISGVPELIVDGETGLLVPERDAQALATALLRMYNEPELGRRFGPTGRAKVMQEFNLHHSAATLYNMFNQDWTSAAITPKQVAYSSTWNQKGNSK